jgi:ABC-type Zn uptake system ZnuABC Zn-binding protein ZnuA
VSGRAHDLGLPALLLGILIAAAGCSAGAPDGSGSAAGRLQVVATTTVFADLVRQVGGPRVGVTSLVPKGGEVHTFDPNPADAQRLVQAHLIVMNGLGLDDWLAGLATKAGASAPIIRLGDGLPADAYLGIDGATLRPGAAPNPHLWLDVANARTYAKRIADALVAADPAGAAEYRAGAAAYDARLAALDTWVESALAAIPAEDRRIVSFHDAFPYYAAAYGLSVVGTVVAAPGQDPSAGDVVALVHEIRASGVRAILSEAQFNPAVARTIAMETGVPIVTDLYTDSVGDAPVDTYEGLMRWDTERIAGALR